MQTCPHCFSSVEDGAAFCSNCGKQMPTAPAQNSTEHSPAAAYPQWQTPTQAPLQAPPQMPPQAAPPFAPQPNPTYANNTPLARGNVFFQNILGLVVFCVIAGTVFALGAFTPRFFDAANVRMLPLSAATTVIFGIAIAITTRAYGPDFSVGHIAFFCSALAAVALPGLGLFATLIICGILGGILGLANGAIIHFSRLPSVLVTLGTGLFLSAVASVLLQGEIVKVEGMQAPTQGVSLLLMGICLVAGVLYVLTTAAGTPMKLRTEQKQGPLPLLLAYPLSGAMAALAGVFLMARVGVATPAMFGSSIYVDLLFVWAAIAASGLLDNRFAPVLWGAAAAGVLAILNNAGALLGMSSYFILLIKAFFMVTLLVAAGLANHFGTKKIARPNQTF